MDTYKEKGNHTCWVLSDMGFFKLSKNNASPKLAMSSYYIVVIQFINPFPLIHKSNGFN